MLGSVESITELERRLEIVIPADEITSKVDEELKKMAPKANLKGFRKGNVPFGVLKELYGTEIRYNVIQNLTQKTLGDALKESKLEPVDFPEIKFLSDIKEGEAVKYEAVFEVCPEIDFSKLSKIQLEQQIDEVSEKEIDDSIENLRTQHASWNVVDRAAKEKDEVEIDFVGKIDGEAFANGSAKNFKVVLGAKQMIAGFEEGLVGKKSGEQFDLPVTFPENYQAKELAGKPAVFAITVNTVSEPSLADLDDAFLEKLRVAEKGEAGIAQLRKQIREQMESSKKREGKAKLYEALQEQLSQKFQFDLPPNLLLKRAKALLKNQSSPHHDPDHVHDEHCNHEHDDEGAHLPGSIKDVPKDILEKAQKDLVLQLFFMAYVKKHDLQLDDAKVREKITEMAGDFERSEEFIRWYYSQERLLNEIRNRVFEEQVLESVLGQVNVLQKK